MSKDKWSALSAEERAQLINIYVQSGITDLDFIKKDYNSFDEGGNIEYTIPSPKDDIEVPYRSVITEDMRNNFITKSKNKFDTFVNKMYPIIERTLIEKELPTDNLHNVLKQMAQESDYGLNPRGNGYNLSGIKAWDDAEGTKFKDGNYYRDFKDYRDYADFYIDLLNNRYNALDAKDTNDYIYRLHHGKDGKSYSADEKGYKKNLTRMYSLDRAIKKYESDSAKGVRILDGSTEENQTLDNTPWYKKVSNALIEGARMGRDARIGAVGAEPLREMYANGQSEEADKLAKQYVRANTAGIGIGAGAASSSLLADLLTTAGTTIIDTIGDGDSKILAKNVAKNAIGDLLGFGAGKALNHFIDLDIIKKAFKEDRLRIGEPTTYTAYHQSNNPITQFTFPYKKRWDVVTHGADPNAAFFTVDTPATSGFLSKRPYTSKFNVTVQKPLIQTGEINGATKNRMRNKIVKRARKLGADGVLFDGIADNRLQNQRILMAFNNSDIRHLSTSITNPSELTDAQWDNLYFNAIAANNLAEAQRLRDLHFKTKSIDNVFVNPDGIPSVNYHGSPETFNEFNINLFGRTDPGDHGVGFYFSPDKEYAEWYGQTRPFYLYAKNPYIGNHSSMLNRGKNAQELIAKHKIDTDKAAERSIQHMLQQQKENTPSKMYEAFGFTGETSEKEIRDAVKKYYNETHNDYVKTLGNIDVADSYKSIDENVIFNPKHIKLSDPITYDDSGNIIPLSKRDNFKSSDIRYTLLPFIGMSLTKDDKNIKADGGPTIIDKEYTSIPEEISEEDIQEYPYSFLESIQKAFERQPTKLLFDSYVDPVEVDQSLISKFSEKGTFKVPDDMPERKFVTYVNSKVKPIEDNTIQELQNLSTDELISLQRDLAADGAYDINLKEGKSKEATSIQKMLYRRKYLSKGDIDGNIGEHTIRALQQMLVDNHYLKENREDGKSNIDGWLGKRTREAFKRFNRDINIDGKLGDKTINAYQLKNVQKQGFNANVSAEGLEDNCAKWVTKKYDVVTGNRSKQNGVYGNAWTMMKNVEDLGGQMIFNIYDDPIFDNNENVADSNSLKATTEKVLKSKKIDYGSLLPGDIIGIYVPSSSHHADVLKEGTTYNTHVGIVADVQNGIPIIEHNINGNVRRENINKLTGSKYGKVTATVAVRPVQGEQVKGELEFENIKSEIKYPEKYKNELMDEYTDALASTKKALRDFYTTVDLDFIERAAIAITKRETNYMTNKMSDQRKNIKNVKNFISSNLRAGIHNIKTPEEKVSQDLNKMKFDSLPKNYRDAIGLYSPEQLSTDPTVTGRATMLLLSKNYEYLVRLAKENPDLNLTKEDIENAVIRSYNVGFKNIETLGFNPDGSININELYYLKNSGRPGVREKSINSTNYKYLGVLGNLIYNVSDDNGYVPYVSAARKEMENLEKN